MANEIQVTASLQASKGGVSMAATLSTLNRDMAGDQMHHNVQIVGTSAEAVDLGDVSTIGYVAIINRDSTNFVTVDNVEAQDNWPQKVLAGEVILLKPQSATIWIKADTASCNVEILALEL